ncbi:MAG: hypothetical protein ABI321_08600 [Polyangia bacterium]
MLRYTAAVVLLWSATAFCYPLSYPALEPLPRDRLAALADAAAQAELAVIESNADGTMKQVTLVVRVRTPIEVVHALVADVGGYTRFVPNMKQSDFQRDADGRMVDTWRLELPVSSFSGRDAYEIDTAPTGPITFHSLDTLAHYRWDFLAIPGGTLLVQTGYPDVLHANRFVRAFVKRQPPLEHGLALAAQYMLVSAIKREAEKRQLLPPVPLTTPSTAPLEALLDRGMVVGMRSNAAGKLEEVSALDRYYAPESRVREVIADVGAYKEFVPGVDESTVTARLTEGVVYKLEMALPILTWSTLYEQRVSRHAIDGVGIGGDLVGARYRWDLAARGPDRTVVTYRANMPLAKNSMLVRRLFSVDASLEYGLNVAFALVQLRSMRARSEKW